MALCPPRPFCRGFLCSMPMFVAIFGHLFAGITIFSGLFVGLSCRLLRKLEHSVLPVGAPIIIEIQVRVFFCQRTCQRAYRVGPETSPGFLPYVLVQYVHMFCTTSVSTSILRFFSQFYFHYLFHNVYQYQVILETFQKY